MRTSRRRLLQFGGSAGLAVLGGCTGLLGSDVKDSDGDGMINTEDYAPWDPEVQEKSDLVGTDEPPGASTETDEPTGTEPGTTGEPPSTDVLFADGFEDGEFRDTFEITRQQSDTDIGVTGDRAKNGGRSLAMRVGRTGSGDIGISREMPELSGPRTLSAWIYPNDPSYNIHLNMHGADGRADMTFSADQHLVYKTDREPEASETDRFGNPSLVANPPVDRWYHLVITAFPDADEARFRAVDETGNEWDSGRVPATVDFDAVTLSGTDYHGDFRFFADDVRLANGTGA